MCSNSDCITIINWSHFHKLKTTIQNGENATLNSYPHTALNMRSII